MTAALAAFVILACVAALPCVIAAFIGALHG